MRLIDHFDRGARRSPDARCLSDANATLTYRQARDLAWRVAARLESTTRPGAGVAVYSPNCALGLACILGLLYASRVWASVNARSATADVARHLSLAGTEVVLFHSSLSEQAAQLRGEPGAPAHWVCIDRPLDWAPALETWIDGIPACPPPEPEADDALAIYRVSVTGGTTGTPKGVLHAHAAAEANVASFMALFRYDSAPRYLLCAPMTHAGGIAAFPVFALGGSIHLLPRAEPGEILASIRSEGITTTFLPPTTIYVLLSHPGLRGADLSSLRYLIFGSAPMSREKLLEAIDAFGSVMTQLYGQTEASMVLTCMRPEDYASALSPGGDRRRLLSCGRAGPFARVEIMDDAGRLLPAGQTGEIVVRSAMVMRGYVGDAAATREAGAHGWHHTGDIGVVDEDGYVYLVDRKRDLIISGGFNVYPSEVEQALWAHPAVQDCAVVGVPDDKWGEAVKGVVELKPGAAVDAATLIGFCRERLGALKAPKSVDFVDHLPRSAVGKVLRREVRALWDGQERRI